MLLNACLCTLYILWWIDDFLHATSISYILLKHVAVLTFTLYSCFLVSQSILNLWLILKINRPLVKLFVFWKSTGCDAPVPLTLSNVNKSMIVDCYSVQRHVLCYIFFLAQVWSTLLVSGCWRSFVKSASCQHFIPVKISDGNHRKVASIFFFASSQQKQKQHHQGYHITFALFSFQ